MEKRDLEKLRREHKDRFGKAKESSRRNSNEVSGSAPASKRNEEAKPTNEATNIEIEFQGRKKTETETKFRF